MKKLSIDLACSQAIINRPAFFIATIVIVQVCYTPQARCVTYTYPWTGISILGGGGGVSWDRRLVGEVCWFGGKLPPPAPTPSEAASTPHKAGGYPNTNTLRLRVKIFHIDDRVPYSLSTPHMRTSALMLKVRCWLCIRTSQSIRNLASYIQ